MKHLLYITNILLTYWTSPSQSVIFPPKTSTVDSSRAPQRERCSLRCDLEHFLLFRLEEIEKNWNKKIKCEIPRKPARTGSLRKVLKSGKSLRIWMFSKKQGKLWYSTTRKKVRYIQPLFNNNNQYWGFRSSALARKRLYKCEIPGKPASKNGFKNRILSCHIEIVNVPLHSP